MFEGKKKIRNLALLHEECELNYRRLHRVMPRTDEVGYSASLFDEKVLSGSVKLSVHEVTRYTSLVHIVATHSGADWLKNIELKVRVYHDAKMAEVVEWCGDRTIPWTLSESSGMQSRDEKWQWNFFLSELLSHGLGRRRVRTKASYWAPQ